MKQLIRCWALVPLIFIWGCEDILEVPDISSSQVTILAPSPGSLVSAGPINLTWEEVPRVTAYAVQLATPDFENAAQVVLDSIIQLDSTYLGPNVTRTLSAGSYTWRVRGLNSDYTTPYSESAFEVIAVAN